MVTGEKDSEPLKDQGSPEKENEAPAEHLPGQASENTDPLNTYKWHTGSKGTLNEVKEDKEEGASSSTSTMDRFQKASTNKWNKMQNWRKALSEDTADKNSSGKSGEATKSATPTRKNPFRRALSEPPGSLLSALSPSSSSANASHAAPSSAGAEASGVSPADPSQRGGGALFKKYLKTVSQKLKRPKLQTRNSTPTLLPGEASECTQPQNMKILINQFK